MQIVQPAPIYTPQAAAARGDYFVARNSTIGTGVAAIASQASLLATAPIISIRAGTYTASLGMKYVVPDYLKVTITGIGTTPTGVYFASITDGAKAAPTGAVAGLTSCVNQASSATALQATFFAGPLAAGAAIAQRNQSGGIVRPVAPVVGDQYYFTFRGAEDTMSAVGQIDGAGIVNISVPCAPVRIGAVANAVATVEVWQFHLWMPGQAGTFNFEYELGFFESTL